MILMILKPIFNPKIFQFILISSFVFLLNLIAIYLFEKENIKMLLKSKDIDSDLKNESGEIKKKDAKINDLSDKKKN